MKIVSFVAAGSNSGKTTLIEKIVRILKGRGLSVGVIKHASKGFALDTPGKDSWRFEQAGADAVVLVGPEKLAIMKTLKKEPDAEDLCRAAGDVDIVIYEGFKKDAEYKIEVFRHGVSGQRPLCMDSPSYIALVSDTPFPVSIPLFNLNDAEAVADFVINSIPPASTHDANSDCKNMSTCN